MKRLNKREIICVLIDKIGDLMVARDKLNSEDFKKHPKKYRKDSREYREKIADFYKFLRRKLL